MTPPTLINLHPNKCSYELHCYTFAIDLDRCAGSCNTLDDLSNTVSVPNEAEDLNLSVESKILIKHILSKCECRFDGRKLNSNHK